MNRSGTIACFVLVAACADDGDDRPWNLPPKPETVHASTAEGVALGRSLFFDPRLSGSNTIACATCHRPELAFTDGLALSTQGASGATLPRHSPPLANLAWATSLFWDGGAKNLESFVLAPIENPDEMDQRTGLLVEELSADETTVRAFEAAFPGEGVTPSTLMRGLSQYLRSLVSADGRYDRFRRGEPGGRLDAAELRGLAVYERDCAACHATDLFTDHDFHVDGLDATFPDDPEDPRRGRARVTFEPADVGAFRTPSLRNLGFTAPYMHDGRFATLDQVVDHYRRGIVDSGTLDARLRRADGGLGFDLTDDEASDLVAFLRTLDEPAFVARSVRDAD